MSEVDDRFVKRGIWTNWSKGATMGRTLTVDARTGNIIIALLTILASMATAQLWNLLAFLYHQSRAKGVLSDGLFWQQQALLRTLPTPTAMMADTTKLWWTWRKKAIHPLLRSSIPLLFALCFSIAALAAGIFTSYVVTSTNLEVLVDSPACSFVNQTELYEDMNSYWLSTVNLKPVVQSYARDCYTNSTFLPVSCRDTFTQPNISFTANAAPCPWESSMCLEGNSPAISMDSGLLDMTQFGLNINQADNVKFRRKSTCNVLPLDGHSFVKNITYWEGRMSERKALPQEEGIAFRYGSLLNVAPEFYPEDSFVHSLSAGNLSRGFTTSALISAPGPGTYWSNLSPLAEMNHSNADVMLVAVYTNQVLYRAPVNDPLFSAHQTNIDVTSGEEERITYYADNPGGVVGCMQQYQFCIDQNSKEDFCTSLSGLPSAISRKDFPTATETQLAILQLLWVAGMSYDITTAPNQDILQVSDLLYNYEIMMLPDDQWVKEAIGWESYAWAGIQTTLLDFIVGPKTRYPDAEEFLNTPTNSGEKHLCKLMKVRKSGGFANVNVFGLAFIITFCAIITLFNMTILRFFIFLSKFRRALAPRVDRWVQDGLFQLQRRAFDAHGEGTWVDLEKEIPSTSHKELLPELSLHSLPMHIAPATASSTTSDRPYTLDDPISPISRSETLVFDNILRVESISVKQESDTTSKPQQMIHVLQHRPSNEHSQDPDGSIPKSNQDNAN